jgi:DNA-binding NarL/FixJ family response regulator
LHGTSAMQLYERHFLPQPRTKIAEHATDNALTPAEISVLRLIAAGNANKQIADQLKITEETVKSQVKCILSQIGAPTTEPTPQ